MFRHVTWRSLNGYLQFLFLIFAFSKRNYVFVCDTPTNGRWPSVGWLRTVNHTAHAPIVGGGGACVPPTPSAMRQVDGFSKYEFFISSGFGLEHCLGSR